KWGNASSNTKVIDLQNIATHELGHGVGLADIYSTACSSVTMYGYSYYGDTEKRTLETPDITGLQTLYGA
ncbi:MAG: matrixin family metalloprotease, partial [Nanoarchaeota archaeon]|nr:matrixin family metalloprotease [Nanoarchaeota archaeon]